MTAALYGITFNGQEVSRVDPGIDACSDPPSSAEFNTTDPFIYLYFYAGTTINDRLSSTWVAPDGSIFDGPSWNPVSGYYCYPGASLAITPDLIPQRFGFWQARVYDNGSLIFIVTFSVSSPPGSEATIFLVHGIAQHNYDMADLQGTLKDPQYGLDPNRFKIDSGFNFSDCASLEDGAARLGQYIDNRNPSGQVILIAYSMGGLLSRDMIVNRRSKHHISLLITLGTPNFGYPYVPADSFVRCDTQAGEMFGDFRYPASQSPDLPPAAWPAIDITDAAGNTVATSSYLYQLNTNWSNADSSALPDNWLAASGDFCANATRKPPLADRGCSDGTRNDGVVCEQSARMLLNLWNGPTRRWVDSFGQYAHTLDGGSAAVFCGNFNGVFLPLYNPQPGGDLLTAIRETVNRTGLVATANVSFIIGPNPVSSDGDGNWTYTVTLQENNGVGVTLNRLVIGGIDYSDHITDWFGSDRLEAYGQLTGSFVSSNFHAPATLIWDVSGHDDNGSHQLSWPGLVRLSY